MSTIMAATRARSSFFEILNRVLYGGEVVFVSKAGSDSLVKIESVPADRAVLNKLAGSVSIDDAVLMKKTIRKAKTYLKRKVKGFD